jgi:PAS domain S-box-containing protein
LLTFTHSSWTSRYAKFALWLVAATAIGGLVYLTGKLAVNREIAIQEDLVSRAVEIHALALRGAAAKFNYLPFTAAQHPDVLAALLGPTDRTLKQKANSYLEDINRRAGSEALYVMDKWGRAIVASNWNTPQSFVNQDYANRPYVIDALAGQSGLFYGVGKTTGEPGLFMSAPVRTNGAVVGLVAVKVDLRRIQETWALAPDPIMLADAKGIFFLGSVASWMYHTNRDLGQEDLDWLNKHDVYGKKQDFPKVSWSKERSDGSAYLLRTQIDGKSKSFLAVSEPLPELGWTLTVTADYASVLMARNRAWMISGLTASLLIVGSLYWRLRKRQFDHLEELVRDRTHDLNEANAFRKAMEDSLLVGMRARDLEGHIIYVNQALCEMTGYTADELMGRQPPYPYWHPEDMEKHWQDNFDAMSGKASLTGFESRIRHRDGHDVYTMIYTAPLIDVAGNHSGWMSSVVDITAQKQMEFRQRQQEEQLQHVQRREIMSEMASTLAHEISQPLTAIGANTTAAKLFAEQGNMPLLLSTLDKIGLQKSRATQIVKAIKDHARKKTLGTETCDMNRIAKSVASFLGPEVKQRKASVSLRLGDSVPSIQGDRVLLEQVLSNLILNSLQAMQDQPETERIVDVVTESFSDAVFVKVYDSGPGIPVEIGEQLFKNFVTTKEKGLGIGLSICRTIIEQHGGRLIFENRPNGGTVFTFDIPCNPSILPT